MDLKALGSVTLPVGVDSALADDIPAGVTLVTVALIGDVALAGDVTGDAGTEVLLGDLTAAVLMGDVTLVDFVKDDDTAAVLVGDVTAIVLVGDVKTAVLVGDVTAAVLTGDVKVVALRGEVTAEVLTGDVTFLADDVTTAVFVCDITAFGWFPAELVTAFDTFAVVSFLSPCSLCESTPGCPAR